MLRVATAAVVAAVGVSVVGAPAGAAPGAAGWSRPFRVAGPETLDVVPAQVEFAPTGAAVFTFGVQNADDPVDTAAYAVLRAAGGRLHRARRLAGVREVLGAAAQGSSVDLLTGGGGMDLACCASVGVLRIGPGGVVGRPHGLLGGLTGFTQAVLEPLAGRRELAAIATDRDVWVAQSDPTGRFGGVHLINSSGAPEAVAAAPLATGGGVVAWTTVSGGGTAAPRRIHVAVGSAAQAPSGDSVPVTVAPGHRIDGIALAAGAAVPALAWVESWYDGRGRYHSVLDEADLTGSPQARRVSGAGELVSGMAFGAGRAGDQVLAWSSCSGGGSCTARAAVRSAGGASRRAQRLGAIDPSQAPALAVAADGRALVGWIDDGNVRAAAGRAGVARSFGRAATVSRSGLASALALAFGSGAQALAAWTEGTFTPSVFGAVYRGG